MIQVARSHADMSLGAARRTVRNTVYWSPAIQMACFSLPRFASDALLQVEEENPRYQRPDLDNQSLSPFDLPERFRLSPDKLWIASANMNMGLRVSPTRQVFNQLSTT